MITDKVNSFEDACQVLNIDKDKVFDSNLDSANDIAFKKLKVIVKALNEGWYPNWENQNENKYWVWWKMKDGFSYINAAYYTAITSVPSALCFKNSGLAVHASKIAYEEYKEYYS